MHRPLSLLVLLILASGCASRPAPDVGDDPAPVVLRPGSCDVTYPDGRPIACAQTAVPLDSTASAQGALCSEQSVPGPQGTIRVLRRPGSTETLLQLALEAPGTHGVVQLRSAPARLWSWHDAQGDETWSLGPVADGESIFVQAYTFGIRDANGTAQRVDLEQLWSEHQGSPFAVHRMVVDGSEYFVQRMVGFEQGGRTTYALASFDLFVGEHLLEARHQRVVTVTLGVHAMPSCAVP